MKSFLVAVREKGAEKCASSFFITLMLIMHTWQSFVQICERQTGLHSHACQAMRAQRPAAGAADLVRLHAVDERLEEGQLADAAEVEAVHIVPKVDLVLPA